VSEQLISILMPAYNCDKFVKQAIDSVLDQSYRNFELLIADDCSTDRTKEVIDSYTDQRIKKFHNKVNLGYLKASNKLFKECHGEYITFQDADDFADKNRLEKLKTFLDENSEIACVGSNIIKVDPENKEVFKTEYPLTDGAIKTAFLDHRIVMTGSALMLRKEVIEKCGIYNEYFDRIGSEDTYLYSFILENFKVANLSEHLYYYRSNPTSIGFTHKDPKAFVGHQMIVQFYKNRLKNKSDFIRNKEWEKADACANYLMAINFTKESPASSIGKFLKAALNSPQLLPMYLRTYVSHLKAGLTKKQTKK
jgi:glycosyltransferase involved in cell wall biosynthesis